MGIEPGVTNSKTSHFFNPMSIVSKSLHMPIKMSTDLSIVSAAVWLHRGHKLVWSEVFSYPNESVQYGVPKTDD